jgi:hypothetical protein
LLTSTHNSKTRKGEFKRQCPLRGHAVPSGKGVGGRLKVKGKRQKFKSKMIKFLPTSRSFGLASRSLDDDTDFEVEIASEEKEARNDETGSVVLELAVGERSIPVWGYYKVTTLKSSWGEAVPHLQILRTCPE